MKRDQHTRLALVREVLGTALPVDWFFSNVLTNEATLRALAERFDVPLMALHVRFDGRVTPEDMREWCACERRGKAVA